MSGTAPREHENLQNDWWTHAHGVTRLTTYRCDSFRFVLVSDGRQASIPEGTDLGSVGMMYLVDPPNPCCPRQAVYAVPEAPYSTFAAKEIGWTAAPTALAWQGTKFYTRPTRLNFLSRTDGREQGSRFCQVKKNASMEARVLKRMSYVSRSSKPFSSNELEALAADAATRNRGLGVTGMLMSSGGIFYQVIEGPIDTVNSLFHKIALDPRHNDVLVLTVQEEVEDRQFPSWAMKKMNLDEGAISRLDPLKALFEAIVVQRNSTTRMMGVLTRSIWQELMEDSQPAP